MRLTSLPLECLELIVERMDPYSRGTFSMTNKLFMEKFYSKEDSDLQKSMLASRKLALEKCHRLIRNIYDNNVLSGWCEICGRETILRTALDDTTERVQWVCVDVCKVECALCRQQCVVDKDLIGLCETCLPQLFPWLH